MTEEREHGDAAIVKYEDGGSEAVNALITMPVMRVQHFLDRRQAIKEMLREVMVDGVDFGTIPGTPKPTLLKAGAEKLLQMFGFTLELVPVEIIENWGSDTEEAFLYYKYEAVLRRPGLEVPICRYTGLAHSRETKWRYRWVPEVDVPRHLDKASLACKPGTASEFVFAINKAETSGKYAKPPEYWEMFRLAIRENRARRFQKPLKGKTADAIEVDVTVYRIPNPEVPDLAHTISAIAQKRAVVGATRYATNASDIFEIKDDTGEDDEKPLDGEFSYIDKQEKSERQARFDRASGKVPGPGADAFPDVEAEKDSLYDRPRIHTNGDPLAPDALLASIRKVEALYAEQYGDALIDTESMKRVAGALGKLVGDANRPVLLQRIANVDSTKELRRCTGAAILKWLGIEKAGYVATRPQAQAEANALLADRPTGREQEAAE